MLIILLAFGIILILFIIALLIYFVAFGQRINPCPFFKYFNAGDYALKAKKIEIMDESKKNILRGYIYRKENGYRGIIVFCHGLGPGQIEYMTLISYFCLQDFTVLAIDNVGCNFSDGKNIRGMYCGVEAACLAVNYIKNQKEFNGMKIHLVGHSLGGYSALCASSKIDCDSVVSISAPYTPASSLYCGASAYINKGLAYILQPFWYIIDFLNFGFNGNLNAAKNALKSHAQKILLIHGEFDKNVPLKYSTYGNVSESSKIIKYMAKNKCHNPYASELAQILINELRGKMHQSYISGEEINKNYFDFYDFEAAAEEDEEVMKIISDFLHD